MTYGPVFPHALLGVAYHLAVCDDIRSAAYGTRPLPPSFAFPLFLSLPIFASPQVLSPFINP
jgi:hypothetical protein